MVSNIVLLVQIKLFSIQEREISQLFTDILAYFAMMINGLFFVFLTKYFYTDVKNIILKWSLRFLHKLPSAYKNYIMNQVSSYKQAKQRWKMIREGLSSLSKTELQKMKQNKQIYLTKCIHPVHFSTFFLKLT